MQNLHFSCLSIYKIHESNHLASLADHFQMIVIFNYMRCNIFQRQFFERIMLRHFFVQELIEIGTRLLQRVVVSQFIKKHSYRGEIIIIKRACWEIHKIYRKKISLICLVVLTND